MMRGFWRCVLLFVAMTAAVGCVIAQSQAAPANVCIDCHSSLDKPLQVSAEQYADDIHAQKGLTCASCHGGDPASADNAMDPKKGFRGSIGRKDVPALCGACHANGNYMRQFNPSLRTDQVAQYRTSVHGKKFADGDLKTAVCIDCHGVHGIRAVSDTKSNVNPLNVAKTCSRCHSDRAYMKEYAISTEQFAEYSASVHAEAMTVRGDLSAPTCTTCHGNHGAAPPGVASVENVCSTCHVLQAQLFDTSPHKSAFTSAGMPGCVTCHSNHRIVRTTDTMIGSGAGSVCTNCHTDGDIGFASGVAINKMLVDLQRDINQTDAALNRAARLGVEVGEFQLEEGQARDSLMKARVSLHSFEPTRVKQDVDAAQKIVAKNQQAGQQALRESRYRRTGLAVSLIAIAGVIIGLKLYISEVGNG